MDGYSQYCTEENEWQEVKVLLEKKKIKEGTYIHIDLGKDRVPKSNEDVPVNTSTVQGSPGTDDAGVYFTSSTEFANTMSKMPTIYRFLHPPGSIYTLNIPDDCEVSAENYTTEMKYHKSKILVVKASDSQKVADQLDYPDWGAIQRSGLAGVKLDYTSALPTQATPNWFMELMLNAKTMPNELVIWDKEFLDNNKTLIFKKVPSNELRDVRERLRGLESCTTSFFGWREKDTLRRLNDILLDQTNDIQSLADALDFAEDNPITDLSLESPASRRYRYDNLRSLFKLDRRIVYKGLSI
jgi:hypothetical protein